MNFYERSIRIRICRLPEGKEDSRQDEKKDFVIWYQKIKLRCNRVYTDHRRRINVSKTKKENTDVFSSMYVFSSNSVW